MWHLSFLGPVSEPSEAEETLGRIAELLEERVTLADDVEEMSVYDRVLDVVEGFEFWSDLAIRRLHEIHRLSAEECEFCAKWLDGNP